jgi:hypothetical protein
VNALFKAAIAACVLSIVAASPALAQVGVMGGLNISTMSVSGDTEGQQFKVQPGLVAGAYFGVPIKKSPKIALRIEVLFSQKGVRIAVAGLTDSARINELEIPVLLAFLAKRGAGTNIRVMAGPAFAVYSSNSDSIDGQPVTKATLRNGELGLKVGVQFDRGKISYGASYTHGVTNYLKADQTTDSRLDSLETRTLSFVVGWRLTKAR